MNVSLVYSTTLSHGQAAVEQGFPVNIDILAPNLKILSLIYVPHS